MKSCRIESCPSGFISMFFGFGSLIHDYLFGMVRLCQPDEFLMVCVWSKEFNKWFSLWYQYDCEWVVASHYLAVSHGLVSSKCYLGWSHKAVISLRDAHQVLLMLVNVHIVLSLEWFAKMEIRHQLFLMWAALNSIRTFFSCILRYWWRCMATWSVFMYVSVVVNCCLVFLHYCCVMGSWLWRNVDFGFGRLSFDGWLIRLVVKECWCNSCSFEQVYERDGWF